MTTPRISVIIPCYNHEQFVEQAIRSVFRQDVPELELVIVDDGSTDGSREIISSLLHQAGRTNVIFHEQPNAGAHVALARGIELSSGEVIAILNSDDLFDDSRLSRLLPHFSQDSDFLVFSGVRLIGSNSEPLPPNTDETRWYELALRQASQCPTVSFALLCSNFCVTSSNLIFSRSLFERVGGLNAYRLCHDWDFILRCSYYVEPLFVPEKLCYYRRHESNTINSRNQATVDEEYQRIVTDFLRRCERQGPENPLAPCRANWPFYFPYFVCTHTRLNSSFIADFVVEEQLTEFPANSFGGWRPWNGGVVELLGRDDLGVLEAAGDVGSSRRQSTQESCLLLRELALVRLGIHEKYESFAPPAITDLELARLWRDSAPSRDGDTAKRT